jgi:signal transduction histidine kinase
MWDWLAHFPWYVHVAMSFALIMAGLTIAWMLRGPRSKNGHEPMTHAIEDRASSVQQILDRVDQAERALAQLAKDTNENIDATRHEMRNLLTPIIGNLTEAVRYLEDLKRKWD